MCTVSSLVYHCSGLHHGKAGEHPKRHNNFGKRLDDPDYADDCLLAHTYDNKQTARLGHTCRRSGPSNQHPKDKRK